MAFQVDIEESLEEAKEARGKAVKRLTALKSVLTDLERKRAQLEVGQTKGKTHLETLKSHKVVLLSEFQTVKNLTDSFELELSKVYAELKNNRQETQATQSALAELDKAVKTLTAMLETASRNVIEYDFRRSEETN